MLPHIRRSYLISGWKNKNHSKYRLKSFFKFIFLKYLVKESRPMQEYE
jgi:hypothetical protein